MRNKIINFLLDITTTSPVKWERRSVKQGEFIWDGIIQEVVRAPYDLTTKHMVMTPKKRSKIGLKINWFLHGQFK